MDDVLNGPYFQYKYLLGGLGLWPYQPVRYKRLFFSFAIIVSISLLIALAAGLGNEESTNLVIIFETIVALFLIFGSFAKCIMLYMREHLLKQLYEQIAENWTTIKDENELAILHAFSLEGKLLAFYYFLFTVPGYFIFAALTYVPILLDENTIKDRSKIFPCYFDHMIIYNGTYHYQISIHAGLGIFYSSVTYIAVNTMYIASVKHLCGLYAIARYRLENVIKYNKMDPGEELKLDEDIFPELLRIVDVHKKAIKGVHLIKIIFSRTFFAVEICLLLCLALLIFDVKYNLLHVRLMFRMFLVAVIFVIHVFYMNYGGEQIIQFSGDVCLAVYFTEWYTTSVRAQKFLLMIIKRTSKPDLLTAGTMSLSMENFASIVKASWSLAMVLFSTQRKSK